MLKRNIYITTVFTMLLSVFIITGCGKTEKSSNDKVTGQDQKTEAKGTSYKISTAESMIDWKGSSVTGSHNGTLNLAGGELFINEGMLTGGNFETDMRSLKVIDLTDTVLNKKLNGHLRSDDFFSVDKNPVSKFEITSVSSKGGSNYEVTGNLTIKGITKPITFPAVVNLNGKSVNAEANIDVDRTLFDIKYNSGKFFEKLGDKLISDTFTLKIKLIANS
jgi:polyisoprenoid-binding protein YceI